MFYKDSITWKFAYLENRIFDIFSYRNFTFAILVDLIISLV